jgi:autotransporter-associated beta strand protein
LVNVSGNNTYAGLLTWNSDVTPTKISSDSGNLALTHTGTILVPQSGRNVELTGSGNGSIAGGISSTGGGGLIKNGTGTWTLTGANTYSGTTTINAGTLAVSNGSALADTGVVTLSNNAGATFEVNTSETIGSLSGGGATGGNVNLNGSGVTLTVAETGSQTFAGVISNSGGLTKTGAGTLSLSNASTSFGTLTINAGRVAMQTNATITGLGGSGGDLRIAGGTLSANLSANSTYNDVISGSGVLAKFGAATLTLGGANTYSGGTTLTAGVLRVANSSGLGTGTLTQASGASTLQFSNAGTVANNMSVYNVSFISGNNTLSGSQTLNNTTYDVASGTTNTLSGNLDGSGGITKTGAGDLVVAGTTNNTFTGNTDVQAGRLVLSKTAGVTAISSTNTTNGLRIASGAVVELAASNQINDAAGLNLDGGTFLTGTSSAGYAETLGTLTLSSTSTIDLGSLAGGAGARDINFGNSSAITWVGTLTIANWQGVAHTSGTAGRIFFGVGGLTSAQLAQIDFSGFGTGAKLLGSGELAPIPEPRVYAAALVLLAAVGWRERKRLRRLLAGSPSA